MNPSTGISDLHLEVRTQNSQKRVLFFSFFLALALHLIANPHYGISRDELYFIICGQNPQWGYVDQPPLAPLLAAASQLLGPSLFALRAIPALTSAASVVVTQLIALELGGGIDSLIFTGLIAFLCPILMVIGLKVSAETANLFLWPFMTYLVLRITKKENPRLWIYFGLAAGISFQSKHSVVFFALALIVGLLFSPHRKILFSRWTLIGGILAAVIMLPHALWEVQYQFPMVELLRNAEKGKNVILSPLDFLFSQVLITHPAYFLISMIGLIWLMRKPQLRFLAITYLVFILEMILLKGKHYYVANVYPVLIASGAVALAEYLKPIPKLKPWLISSLLILGLIYVPYSLPILPVDQFISYHNKVGPWLHMSATKTEKDMIQAGHLDWPEWSDMQGWPDLAKTVAHIYSQLPASERSKAAILTRNYGQASAIKYYSNPQEIPPVLSGHNQYFLWGPGEATGEVLIDVGGDCLNSLQLYESSQIADTFIQPKMRSTESELTIRICRGIKRPLHEVWDSLKLYL